MSGAPSGHELTPDNLAPLSAARAGANAEPKAKATIIARQTDLYFIVEDMKAEAAYMSQARFRVIPSLWGHMAGAGLTPADSKFIEREVKALLAI